MSRLETLKGFTQRAPGVVCFVIFAVLGAFYLIFGAIILASEITKGVALLAVGVGLLWCSSSWNRRSANHYATWMKRCVCVVLALPVVATYVRMTAHHYIDHATGPECANNLKQMGLILKMYANDHPDTAFPRLSSEAGRLMFDNNTQSPLSVYPEYLTDFTVLYCPESAGRDLPEKWTPESAINDQSFFYLGYAIANQAEMEAFAGAYKATVAASGSFEGALDYTNGKGTIHRFQDNDERQDAEKAHLPLLIERPGNHEPDGGYVLYADGHVEFIKMGAKWPMTEEAMAVLLELDALGSK